MTEFSYDFWHNALAGTKQEVHDGHPQPGFYRLRRREKRGPTEGKGPYGPWMPVAIFEHDGALVAMVNDTLEVADAIWTWVCRNPVTEADYRAARETGKWPDVADGAEAESADTSLDGLQAQFERASAGVETYATVKDDDDAMLAQSLRSRLLEISREADKARTEEKAPHLEAGKAVDAKWQPIVKAAKAAADRIATALGAYETKKAKDHAAQRINEPLPTQVKGGTGRAATVKVVNVVTAITDQDALYAFMRDRDEIKELLRSLAQRAVNAGHTVPGVAVEEQRKVA